MASRGLRAADASSGSARHVVLIVWDGMRPDFVDDRYAPTLDKLAHDGVRFQNHHSVYLSATDVNGVAIATGVYPNHSGLFANSEFRPSINPHQAIDTSEPATIAAGDRATNGGYLHAPTMAELLRRAGKSVAIAGSKSVVLLHDRQNEWTVATSVAKGLTVFAGAPIAPTLRDDLTKRIGAFPTGPGASGAERSAYATRALTDVFWRDGIPDFSLLWLVEPDLAEHNNAPGSPPALGAIKSADENLARMLAALDAKHARDATDILLFSDHGFSTIRRSFDVAALLKDSGFRAAKEISESPRAGDILVVGNGGTVLFYVHEHDRAVCERLVTWLQHQDFTGTIFTRDKIEGAFPLSAVRIDTPDAADVVMSFRWTSEKNEFGVPGLIDADWNRKPGEGTHATLSPSDLHNTFIAAGPDFRHTFDDTLPTGNIDIAPTVLHLLGIKDLPHFDGRVLREALRDFTGELPVAHSGTLSVRAGGEEAWEQSLRISGVEATTYFDAARGGISRK
ncbi:MAG: alkaline phosphatase family protein [Chthoniobacterales bacterium]